jgi:hypothetical protein
MVAEHGILRRWLFEYLRICVHVIVRLMVPISIGLV